jgi:hypothetical protein
VDRPSKLTGVRKSKKIMKREGKVILRVPDGDMKTDIGVFRSQISGSPVKIMRWVHRRRYARSLTHDF